MACRLLRKAHAARARVVVHASPATLQQLDQMLWTFDQLSFVPHARLRAGQKPTPELLTRTPIWLVESVDDVVDRDVLVQLGNEMVEGWNAFSRVIEIVGSDGADSSAARQRWRTYAAHEGVEMIHHPAKAAA